MSTTKPHNAVSNPWHYRQYSIDCVDVIESWGLGFHLGNTLKYICRAPHKGTEIEDLKKSRWYLDRWIKQLEKKGKNE